MGAVLFDYPKKAFFGRAIPKSKFYEYGNVTTKLKDLFVKQVDQIIWAYKLAPETINVQATKDISEIQVFEIGLKGEDLDEDVLLCIDKTVQYPIIFEVKSVLGVKTVAAYKLNARMMSHYLKGAVCKNPAERVPLNFGLNLNGVYEQILVELSGIKLRKDEGLDKFIQRGEVVKEIKAEITALQRKIASEKQFNKKVDFNSRLQTIRENLARLLE
jgi:Domain of unknown function (DUF4391)